MPNSPDEPNRQELANELGQSETPSQILSDQSCEKTLVNTPSTLGRGLETTVAQRFGRYEIIKKLGEGGMGAVFHARDTSTGEEVALKVLVAGCLSQPDSLRRFEKEARLLEEAKNPHVANLLDVGTEGETRFLVMEFVSGGDLRAWMNKRTSSDELTSLGIISDVCRALVNAHANGMVHRDIKPENILLEEERESPWPSVKLTDFGLARHINQSESLKLTQTGMLLGTPYYMSPEQFTGKHEISPTTDVYSIGITLFELLTGSRPFTVADPIRLASAHCFETPPDVRKLNPQLSDATADLVRRMLAKHPGQRPPDSSSVLDEILRLQSGNLSHYAVHPLFPDHKSDRVFHADFECILASSPHELWPYVSNTDRVNRAADLPPINYETITDSDGHPHKFGNFRLAGVAVRWEEHPYEWIEGQKLSVLREFPSGPFVWFMNTLELIPRDDGSTHLKQHISIESRGILGRILAQLEVGLKGKRNFERIYRRIDNTIRGQLTSKLVIDAFHEPTGLNRGQQLRLTQRLDRLRASGVTSEIVEVFRDLFANAAVQDITRIQPIVIARLFGLSEQDVINATLQAVPIGLLTLHWDIICPTCRLGTGVKSTLKEIELHANCAACQIDFEIEFGNSLELIFRAHPEIRSSDPRTYCAGGPGNFPHVVAQIRLNPGERFLLPLSLEAGSYIARGPRLSSAVMIEVSLDHGLRHGQIICGPELNRNPPVLLRGGHQTLAMENHFPYEQVIRIERTRHRSEALTAAHATGLPLFRKLFPDQTLTPGLLVEMATASFLAIQIANLDEIFRDRGDAETYLVLQNFNRIAQRRILHHQGLIIDDSRGILLASFADPCNALKVSCELGAVLANEDPQNQWLLSGGLHRGPALVTGNRQEVNYFGATINRTLQLARDATASSLLLTREIWSDPVVAVEFKDHLVAVDLGSRSNQEAAIQQIGLNTFPRILPVKS